GRAFRSAAYAAMARGTRKARHERSRRRRPCGERHRTSLTVRPPPDLSAPVRRRLHPRRVVADRHRDSRGFQQLPPQETRSEPTITFHVTSLELPGLHRKAANRPSCKGRPQKIGAEIGTICAYFSRYYQINAKISRSRPIRPPP